MYCVNCGQVLDHSGSACRQCGTPLDEANGPSVAGQWGRMPWAPVPWRGRQVIVGIFLLLAGSLAILLMLFLFVVLTGEINTALVAWLTSALLGLLIFATVWLLGLRPYRVSLSALGLRIPARPLRAALLTAAALAGSMGSTVLYGLAVRALGIDILLPPNDYTGIVFSGPAAVFTFAALALWTPLTEEVFFRGFVFGGLVAGRGILGAAITSALIFSAFHVTSGPGVLIPIFITGLLLAWVYRETGSLWASIAAHAGQNGVLLLVTIYGLT